VKRRSAAARPNYRTILELENELDLEFRKRAPRQPLGATLMAAAQRWSQAVCAAAESRPDRQLSGSEVARGLSLAQRPVFVCGVQRSGTTLLRDLLDGHPRLVVIPTESAFDTGLEPALFRLRPDRHAEYLVRQWLERLVLPPPHWLLGRSCSDGSPYVDFANAFAAWLRVGEQHREARIPSWPLCSLALACARHVDPSSLPATAQRWVEKSPTSERFLPRIWHDFPAAKVIHIVRRPDAVLESYAALNRHVWATGQAARFCLLSMAPSYRIARQRTGPFQSDRYLQVRYEDLVADRAGTMARIAAFLDIETLPLLHEPTVAGRPAVNNSSFDARSPRRSLNVFERALLSLTAARNARALGYR
jgi:hypothetical protein